MDWVTVGTLARKVVGTSSEPTTQASNLPPPQSSSTHFSETKACIRKGNGNDGTRVS